MGGTCIHQNTASEQYQSPGIGGTCGRPTFHAIDEPETARVNYPDGSIRVEPTGVLVAREYPDPHCPLHGGTPDPEAGPAAPAPGGDLGEGLAQAFGLIRQHASNLAVARGDLSALTAKVEEIARGIEQRRTPAGKPADPAPADKAPAAAPSWADAAAAAADAVNSPAAAAPEAELSHGPRPGWGQVPQEGANGGQGSGEGA